MPGVKFNDTLVAPELTAAGQQPAIPQQREPKESR